MQDSSVSLNRTLFLLAVLAPLGTAQVTRSIPTSAADFVEVAGEKEFRGVLVARPLQVADAAEYGLTPQEVDARASLAREAMAGLEQERYEYRTDEWFIRVPVGSSERELADALLGSGGFQYVEPDWRVYPVDCPDDSQFGSQWHHQAQLMNSCDAWDIATGDPSVVVAICDTGLRTTHEDIQLHRQEGYNAVDQQFENSGGDISPVHPHGTMCTGCAVANGDNGVGISGVGWNLGNRMMRVSNVSSGSSSIGVLTHAAMTAADLGDRVASVSYSGVDASGVQTAGQYCRANGTLLVWAAGNAGSNLGGNRDDDVLVVGATDINDNLAGFSNFGSFVDLVAPGVSVFTMDSGNDSDYANVSGTSFACPLAAGLAGLIFSVNPGLTPQEVEDAMRQGCDDLGAPGLDNTFGYGRIDVLNSVQLANLPIQIGFPTGRPEFVDPNGGTSMLVTVDDGSGSAMSNSGRLWVDDGSGFQLTNMSEVSPGLYDVNFPSAPCGSDLAWYVEFDLMGGGSQSLPLDAPNNSFSSQAWVLDTVFSDDLEANVGWTGGIPGDDATTGQWTYGDPIGTGAQPGDDHTEMGTNCWFTGQGPAGGGLGDNDIDGGTTTLLSPILSASGMDNPVLSYWRWYSNNTGASPNADTFVIDISNDGGTNWTNVEVVGPAGAGTSGGWIQHSFNVADVVAPTDMLQLRFIASDLGSGSVVEAAIDDLALVDFGCGNIGTNFCVSAGNSVSASGSSISASGSTSLTDADLTLDADNVPTQPGLFYFGPDQLLAPFGNGFRCVGGQVIRMPVISGMGGQLTYAVDFGLYGAALTNLGTVNFQAWYRDPADGGANFNLSDGLQIVFAP